MDAKEYEKHLSFINTPNKWPRWPILPLKRSPRYAPQPTEAYLWGDLPVNGTAIRVYHGNIFRPSREDPFREYQDIWAILDDGWRVD